MSFTLSINPYSRTISNTHWSVPLSPKPASLLGLPNELILRTISHVLSDDTAAYYRQAPDGLWTQPTNVTSSLAEAGYYDVTCRRTQRKIHLHNINGLRWADKALNRMTRGPILEQVMFRFHDLSALYDFVISHGTPLTEVRRIEVCLES